MTWLLVLVLVLVLVAKRVKSGKIVNWLYVSE
jgi:hypothetical protein